MTVRAFLLIALTLIISGCAAPQSKKLDPYLVNFNKEIMREMGAEFRAADRERKAATVRLYSAFNTARQSPKFLYQAKLSEAKGLLMEYKAGEIIEDGTAAAFSELAKYMSEPHTDRYLHEYVDYILKRISVRIS
tara:strand:- start:280 stop:684 length:405 start_codon:yes stop_codon:yes gene_type:complete